MIRLIVILGILIAIILLWFIFFIMEHRTMKRKGKQVNGEYENYPSDNNR